MQVQVYRCLGGRREHRGLWSVRLGGRVIGHAEVVAIDNPVFKVNLAGWEKVLRDQRKNVHAFIEGHLVAWGGKGGGWVNPTWVSSDVHMSRQYFARRFELLEDSQRCLDAYGKLTDHVTYNPYERGDFFDKDKQAPVFRGQQAVAYVGHGVRYMPTPEWLTKAA